MVASMVLGIDLPAKQRGVKNGPGATNNEPGRAVWDGPPGLAMRVATSNLKGQMSADSYFRTQRA